MLPKSVPILTPVPPRLGLPGPLRPVPLLLVVVLLASACATSTDTGPSTAGPVATAFAGNAPSATAAAGLRVSLLEIAAPTGREIDRGWRAYRLLLEHPGPGMVRISNVRLQTSAGQLVAPAGSHAELQARPERPAGRAQDLGGQVATRAAGIAAGQVLPFGGLMVQALSGVGTAAMAEAGVRAERAFRQHSVEGLELAPGARTEGQVWFPAEITPVALVLVVTEGADWEHLSLPLVPPAAALPPPP